MKLLVLLAGLFFIAEELVARDSLDPPVFSDWCIRWSKRNNKTGGFTFYWMVPFPAEALYDELGLRPNLPYPEMCYPRCVEGDVGYKAKDRVLIMDLKGSNCFDILNRTRPEGYIPGSIWWYMYPNYRWLKLGPEKYKNRHYQCFWTYIEALSSYESPSTGITFSYHGYKRTGVLKGYINCYFRKGNFRT